MNKQKLSLEKKQKLQKLLVAALQEAKDENDEKNKQLNLEIRL